VSGLPTLSSDDRAAIQRQIELDLEIEKRACERSLEALTRSAWSIIEPGTKLKWNWHLRTICGYLEAFNRGEFPDKRLIINVPPGTMKSIIVSVMFPLWIWLNDRTARYVTVSCEEGLAVRDARRMKQIIESEWFQRNWDIKLSNDQNEKMLYENTERGFRQALGINSKVTGKRGDLMIIDDPLDAKQGFSDVIRQGVNDAWDQGLSSRLNDLEHSGVVLIMQRLHAEDLTGHLLKKVKSKWTRLTIPMRYEGSPTFDAGKDIGRPDLNDPRTQKGELLFPERFSEKATQALEEDLGEYGTAGQLQQRPVPTGGGILKKHWWRVWADDVKLPTCDHIFHSWDTAFSEKDMQNAAFSACTRWGIFWHEQRERYCILALGMWFERLGYDELRAKLKEMDKKYNPDVNLIERKATGISLIQDMKRASPGRVRAYSPGKGEDKVSRAHSVSPMLQSGLVYVPNKLWAIGDGKSKLGLIDYAAQFPNGGPPSADLCFVAGTLIATKRGDIPIEEITTNDYVLTPIGWKKVKATGFTGIRHVISKCGLVGTKNHPVYTFDKGFKNLDTITQASKLMRSNVCDFIKIARLGWLNLTVENTEEYQLTANIILLIGSIAKISRKVCMSIFGDFITDKMFQMDMKSIISMVIRLTIALRILSAYRVVCIGHCLKKILIKIKSEFSCKVLDLSHLNGTNQMLAEHGIVKMQREPSAHQKHEKNLGKQEILLRVLKSVFGAAKSLNIKASVESSAHQDVRLKKVDIEEVSISSSINTMRPVFNLSVDYPNCYFANGILVHNCDTITQALIYLRAGNWAGDHPDDHEEIVEHPLTEEQEEDLQPQRRSYYG
jgi:phage terminase large subunit-like protein